MSATKCGVIQKQLGEFANVSQLENVKPTSADTDLCGTGTDFVW